MARRRYLFDPPERFVTGTIGRPGDRTFFLQARDGARVVSVVVEKTQVAVLADRLGDLLAELERRGVKAGGGPAGTVDTNEDTGPLDEPINEAFRAGSLTLGWDGDSAGGADQRGVSGRLTDAGLGRRLRAGAARSARAGRGR